MKSYSLNQTAKKLGISGAALSRYVKTKKLPAPWIVHTGWKAVHIWTEEDIETLRKFLPKIANGRKTRYKKKHSAGTQQTGKTKARKGKT